MKGFVLTYHSHHVVGGVYTRNDHVALAADLELIAELGCEIVPLRGFVDAVFGSRGTKAGGSRSKVSLTFDDGPIYGVEPFTHPRFGPQRGFLRIMRDFIARRGTALQPGLSATSFVIASPEARA